MSYKTVKFNQYHQECKFIGNIAVIENKKLFKKGFNDFLITSNKIFLAFDDEIL